MFQHLANGGLDLILKKTGLACHHKKAKAFGINDVHCAAAATVIQHG